MIKDFDTHKAQSIVLLMIYPVYLNILKLITIHLSHLQ
jgi:hypothetical protein